MFEQFSIPWLSASHLSELTWSNVESTFHNSYVILMLLPSTVIVLDRSQLMTQKQTKQGSYGEVIATKILRSLLWTGWPLRNIHFLHGNECFPFYIEGKDYTNTDNTLYGLGVTRRVSEKKQELLILRKYLVPYTCFDGVGITHLFSFFCVMLLFRLSSLGVLWCYCFVCLR